MEPAGAVRHRPSPKGKAVGTAESMEPAGAVRHRRAKRGRRPRIGQFESITYSNQLPDEIYGSRQEPRLVGGLSPRSVARLHRFRVPVLSFHPFSSSQPNDPRTRTLHPLFLSTAGSG